MVYEWIIANKEVLKIVYALVICFICAVIVLKSDRLFKLSDYQGIRYFRNAFFFYGLAFFVRFILGGTSFGSGYMFVLGFVFEFLAIMAGFFLFYSLIWKRVEKKENHNSLFNIRIGIFYLVALLLVFFDYRFATNLFMYISQILLFVIMSFVTFKNYLGGGGGRHGFLKFYFLAMVLGVVTWALNMVLYYFLEWNKAVQMAVYGLNIIFFLFFLYGIVRVFKVKNG